MTEVRNPKEARNPKSERQDGDSAFWHWADSSEENRWALNDDKSDETSGYDLMERTAQFGEQIVRFAKKIPRGIERPENNRLIDQLVGAATSIGANYCEADDAVSGKDFKCKIGISRKESKETMFFLRMIAASEESLAREAHELWREAKELNLIFGSIWRK